MNIALDLTAGLALVVWASFVVLYHVRAAWARTEQGRNIMGVSLGIAGFLAVELAEQLWPSSELRPLVELLVYVGLAALGAQRILQMLRLQRSTRNTRRAKVASPTQRAHPLD